MAGSEYVIQFLPRGEGPRGHWRCDKRKPNAGRHLGHDVSPRKRNMDGRVLVGVMLIPGHRIGFIS